MGETAPLSEDEIAEHYQRMIAKATGAAVSLALTAEAAAVAFQKLAEAIEVADLECQFQTGRTLFDLMNG